MPQAGVAQLVEHQLPKLGVAGSNPVSRSYYEAHVGVPTCLVADKSHLSITSNFIIFWDYQIATFTLFVGEEHQRRIGGLKHYFTNMRYKSIIKMGTTLNKIRTLD